jgi:MOSC domain-containing protein YiiM
MMKMISYYRSIDEAKGWDKMMKVTSIVYKPEDSGADPEDQYVRIPLSSALLVTGHGLEGDSKGGHPKRQLNIMSAEAVKTLSEDGFKTLPGQLGEQITIQGLDMSRLNKGDRLQIGETARVEIVSHRTGCERFERIQGKSPRQAAGRLGVMARVVVGGPIQVGSLVKLNPPI